ncbi:hypothetical protein [Dyadobacter psychrotolerans]|uniref:Uncharacterized protein n=1 Tax=Dyadobacter psychrotolerans TaxID=2541721 RepID=A0A4R5DHR1_9BACT|nr:hypothetical protein [Dyadobacter psychrotolerans]TDE12807.1 hypothetical protein E0F88_20900 [Dyadobacter psychrotolerans]
MGKKRAITIYDDMDGPYLESLRQGMTDTVEGRYYKFFEEIRKFNKIMGIKKDPNARRTIEIKGLTWM